MLTKAEIQRLRSLREKKVREELGLFVLENPKTINELAARGFPWLEFYATADSPPPTRLPPSCRVAEIAASELERASHLPTPSGWLAVGQLERRALDPGSLRQGLTLALDGVQDAGNVGTLLRIADWFALDRVILSPTCADLFHQKVVDASMGSFARVPVFQAALPPLLQELGEGTPVLGCDLEGDPLPAVVAPAAAVIVIGSEGRGLSETVKPHVTQRITIPRYGEAESLNASVAAGIICAHLRGALGPPR